VKERVLRLQELLQALPEADVKGPTEGEITHLAYDSRKVKSQGMFVAISGHREDGHRYIGAALEKGATAIVVEREDVPCPDGVTRIRVLNSRDALSRLSACFFGRPASRLKMVGITGTGGKTTTAYLIESVLRRAGIACGVLGSVSYRYGDHTFPAPVTTPESLDLQELLAGMVREKVTHVVMEVSSHALDQGRIGTLSFDQAVFTNLSQDHLDYHREMEHYFQAKARLFRHYLKREGGTAVINGDDPYGQRLLQELEAPKKRFGLKEGGDYFPLETAADLSGLKARIHTPKGVYDLRSPLIGRFNFYNLLAAWAVADGFEVESRLIQEGLQSLARVPGRMEPIPNALGLTVIVDYSHKPEALRFALEALREYGKGKIVTVFGCGGDRDRKKRPLMGKISGTLSDLTVITSDNPRSEDPLAIIRSIEEGLKEEGISFIPPEAMEALPPFSAYTVVPDRREAIALAVRLARPGDRVLIAGKGHENYQIIGDKILPFDDREEARKVLEARRVQHR
jgi:UDP-N-acetylmuramoyl-L-alanyl-D-glutamate--2,6-diaminopimelate ligase